MARIKNTKALKKRTRERQKEETPPSPPAVSIKFYFLTIALITIVGFSIYSNILNAPFLYDDVVFRDNPIVNVSRVSQIFDILLDRSVWRRVGFITFAFNFYLGGLDPFGYHFFNIVIHLATAVVLFFVAYKTLTLPVVSSHLKSKAHQIALLGSLIWLVHPVQIMAVSYTVQRFSSLAALFFVLSLLCYILGRMRHSRSRILLLSLSILSGLLALGSKQNAAILPFVILLYEFFFFMDLSYKENKNKLLVSLIILAFLSMVVVFASEGLNFVDKMSKGFLQRGWTPNERLLTQFRVVVLYITLLIYPHPSRLNVDYDFILSRGLFSPPTTFISLIFLASILIFSIYWSRRNRLFSFAVLWFFFNLVVESTILPLDLVYEHRLYLPSMGPVMLFTGFVCSLEPFHLRRVSMALSVLVILVLSYWTHQRNYVWQNPITVWEDNVKKSPNKARVHGNLGKAYLDAGEYEKARSEFEKVIALDPKLLGAYDNLATIYIDHYKQYDRAREYLYEVLKQKDDHPSPYLNLGVINLRLRELPEAIVNFQKVLEHDPKNLLGHYNLAASYFNLKDYLKAIAILKKGISLWPRSSKLYGLLGISYYYQGDKEKAETALRKALELDPKNMMAVEYLKKMMAGMPGEGASGSTKP